MLIDCKWYNCNYNGRNKQNPTDDSAWEKLIKASVKKKGKLIATLSEDEVDTGPVDNITVSRGYTHAGHRQRFSYSKEYIEMCCS